MLSSRRRNFAALVAVGALAVAGCGGDDGGTQPDPNDSAAAVPTTVDSPGPDDMPETPDPVEPADEEVDPAEQPDEPTEPADEADAVGDPAATAPEILQVSAPLINGDGELDLATLADRPLLLWFWAPF